MALTGKHLLQMYDRPFYNLTMDGRYMLLIFIHELLLHEWINVRLQLTQAKDKDIRLQLTQAENKDVRLQLTQTESNDVRLQLTHIENKDVRLQLAQSENKDEENENILVSNIEIFNQILTSTNFRHCKKFKCMFFNVETIIQPNVINAMNPCLATFVYVILLLHSVFTKINPEHRASKYL